MALDYVAAIAPLCAPHSIGHGDFLHPDLGHLPTHNIENSHLSLYNSETVGHDYPPFPKETDWHALRPSLQQYARSFSPPSHRESSPSTVSWPTSATPLDEPAFIQSQAISSRSFCLEQPMRCPHPDCGKVFKDIKAHMLTHQAERPEKCPVLTCEYHQKGFARKYDSTRHTLTHFRGELVCGFCPGSGTTGAKTFNRADVMKRHLAAVHGVEQIPPNSRKRSPANTSRKHSSYCPDATGMCSICRMSFTNAQAFYMHLDACVLRAVHEQQSNKHRTQGEGEAAMELAHRLRSDAHQKVLDAQGGAPALPISSTIRPRKEPLTWSKGGVSLVGKDRKKKKHYPDSWGLSVERTKMKKRVLCVYDGERRLYKDNVPVQKDIEVLVKLLNEEHNFTKVDLETSGRTKAIQIAAPDHGLWQPLRNEDQPYAPFGFTSQPRRVPDFRPSAKSPDATKADRSVKPKFGIWPLVLTSETVENKDIKQDVSAQCAMDATDSFAAPEANDRERKEAMRQKRRLRNQQAA
jgi:hypothetical protein